ncbi:MAG: hypothetical protein KQH63_03725 [Desulfobulbaceae bacterium]|nr:hypothetical protein [Desulfobulbaceae bacterium]
MTSSPVVQTLFLWSIWCTLHSVLIAHWWLNWLHSILGERLVQGWYRLFFNVFSMVTVTGVVFYQFSLKQVILFSWPGWWQLVKTALYLYSAFMFYAGWRKYDLPFFLGIKQLKGYLAKAREVPSHFNSNSGGGVRHPWYSGGIALVWAFGAITDVSLASKIILSLYFIIGTLLEERKLRAHIGTAYDEYCRHVPMLFPSLRFKK